MVRDALAREPRLYAMGMGGWDKPLPQMLKRLKWRMSEVPFYFKVVHPGRFLRNIRVLRTSALRRLAMDAAAVTGVGLAGDEGDGDGAPLAGAAGGTGAGLSRGGPTRFGRRRGRDYRAGWRSATPRRWMNSIRRAIHDSCACARAGGWAVLLDTRMEGHKQFGGMRVGTIVDGLAAAGHRRARWCARRPACWSSAAWI